MLCQCVHPSLIGSLALTDDAFIPLDKSVCSLLKKG